MEDTKIKKREIIIPEDVKVNYIKEENKLIVEGPKGKIEKKFGYDKFFLKIENKKLIFEYSFKTLSQKKNAHTVFSIIKNMIKGVKEGFVYKLKIFSTHFPMQVKYQNNKLSVVNFLGEKKPRELEFDKKILEKYKISIKIQGEEIIVEGIDKEVTGNIAAKIEQLTRITDRDRRKFQDGIYIVEKAGKAI